MTSAPHSTTCPAGQYSSRHREQHMKWRADDINKENALPLIGDVPHVLSARKSMGPTAPPGHTGTWPPRRPQPPRRPGTATLERPQLLDIGLLHSLDMSLVRKEFLCITNLCASPIVHHLTPKRARPRRPTTDKETSEDSLEDDENNSARSRAKKISKINKFNYRKLQGPKQQKIIKPNIPKQPLKINRIITQKNREPSETGTSIITGTVNGNGQPASQSIKSRLPQPCTTCGRPEQPERFHSHPQVPAKVVPKLTTPAPMKSTVQKPLPIRYKSKNPVVPIPKKVKPPVIVSKEAGDSVKDQGTGTKVSGPKTLTCYICGREFGTASLRLHEPKCIQRWERENSELPRHLQRKAPIRPSNDLPADHWNKLAWEASQAGLAPCQNCGRTFLPDRLLVHQRSCRPGAARVSFSTPRAMSESPSSPSPASPGPPTVRCYVCGRMFGTKSIGIHEPQCLKKWHQHNDQLPASQRKRPPERDAVGTISTPIATTSAEVASPVSTRPVTPKKPTLPCYICGREYGTSSIYIHEPQCLRKWRAENDKLPPEMRRKEPQRPDIKFTPSGGVDFVGTFNRIWENHLAELVPCRICGRRFFPDRIERHEQACNNLPIERKKK